MIQDSTMMPGTRRQELQWSREIMGIRSLTSLGGTKKRIKLALVLGRGFRSESSGTEIVYRMALQKQPPWS